MYPHHPRRRKKRPIHGTKVVQLMRGKCGYGFTISGQHPCVLSCIVNGSPAELAGLKPGDYLIGINSENVSKYSHDDVVRIVGLSTGNLELQIAENYNSSDSSDDDYHPRSKSRYPNRIRSRHLNEKNVKEQQYLQMENHSRHSKYSDTRTSSSTIRNHVPVGAEAEAPKNLPSQISASNGIRAERNHLGIYHHPELVGAEGGLPREYLVQNSAAGAKVDRSTMHNFRQIDHRFPMTMKPSVSPKGLPSSSSLTSARHHGKGMEPIVSRAENLESRQGKSYTHPNYHSTPYARRTVEEQNRLAEQDMSIVSAASAFSQYVETDSHHEELFSPNTLQAHSQALESSASYVEEEEDDRFCPCPEGDLRAIVGYVGSIEMPSNASRPFQKLQSLRNAVRRLRIEQKIHTLVLMEVDANGVKLTNTLGSVVAHYPVDRIAFSGICPDDKRFFGIVTLHDASDDMSELSMRDDRPPSGSCHIFMVDPELRPHNVHNSRAKAFQIQCTIDPETQHCSEFPRSATPIILSVVNLYRDRPRSGFDFEIVQSHAFADPVRAAQRSSSNSSNSDSGLGFGKEDNGNDQVYVVDMPHAEEQLNATSKSESSYGYHLSPDRQTMPMPTPIRERQRPLSAMEVRRLNNSTSSEECWQMKTDKLNLRAMPDPVQIWRSRSTDGLEKQNSAENLRQSMHKLLEARQRKLSEHTSSDSEPHPFGMGEQAAAAAAVAVDKPPLPSQRPISAPFTQLTEKGAHALTEKVETVDLAAEKLSPRAFFKQPAQKWRSPSAPPIPYFPHQDDTDDDDDSEDDPCVRTIISRLNKDKALGLGSEDPRRFSEGYALSKRREKEKVEVEGLQKWSKMGSLRRNKGMKQILCHSQESLAVGDQDETSQKLSIANSVNNIAHIARPDDKVNDGNRVAGWAVSFDKLLHDTGGLAVFTEFLKKEFSEENILFWRVCEKYKQITDEEQRKIKAKEIFDKHLSTRASDPVNVDSASRQHAQQFVDSPTPTMFEEAQHHIYQLMRQDSYARFLKSDMYKMYLMREMEGKPLDLPKDEFSQEKGAGGKDDRKKKGKENDEKRRRSLLPWRQNKKSSSKTSASDSDLKRSAKQTKDKEVNNNKKQPGPGIDLSTMRKEVFQSKEQGNASDKEGEVKFCRVILPDGSTTVVCAKPGQNIRTVMGKLCEKRNISVAAVDVFLHGSEKPLELNEDVSTLGSKEVVIEKRVLFRMDLPNKKSIGVKAKPNRTIREVFKPILNKYGYRIDAALVKLSSDPNGVDVEQQVSTIDNQRVIIYPHEEGQDWGGANGLVTARPPPARHKPASHRLAGSSLEEITNRIFEDLMKGKSEIAHKFDELGVLDLEKTKGHKNLGEVRSLGLFGLRKKETTTKEVAKQKQKSKVTFAPQKSENKSKGKNREDEKFFDLVSKVQGQRLDDQRGVSTQNTEIPEFLRTTESGQSKDALPSYDKSKSVDQKTQWTFSSNDLFDEVEYMTNQSSSRPKYNGSYMRDQQEQNCANNTRSIQRFRTFGSNHAQLPTGAASQKQNRTYVKMNPAVVDAGLDSGQQGTNEDYYVQDVVKSPTWADKRQLNYSKPKDKRAYNILGPLASPEQFSPRRPVARPEISDSDDEVFSDNVNPISVVNPVSMNELSACDKSLLLDQDASHSGNGASEEDYMPVQSAKRVGKNEDVFSSNCGASLSPSMGNPTHIAQTEAILGHSVTSGFRRVQRSSPSVNSNFLDNSAIAQAELSVDELVIKSPARTETGHMYQQVDFPLQNSGQHDQQGHGHPAYSYRERSYQGCDDNFPKSSHLERSYSEEMVTFV